MLEPEPLSHSLALNYVEQILQNLSSFGELSQAQPTSIAVQLSHFPRITFHNLPVICLLLSDFREQRWRLTVPSLLQSAKAKSVHHSLCTQTTFFLYEDYSKIHSRGKELKSATQINLPLCHKYSPTIYEAVIQVGFVRGSLQYSYYVHLHGFLHKRTHAHTYTKRRVVGWVLPQTGAGRGIKLNGCCWGPREPDFARLSECLLWCSPDSNDSSVASTYSFAFSKHISQKYWDQNEQQDQVPAGACLVLWTKCHSTLHPARKPTGVRHSHHQETEGDI